MKIISRYIGTTVVTATLTVLVLLTTLDFVLRLVETIDKVTESFSAFNLIAYELLGFPSRIYEAMPTAGMIGCLVGLGAMANNNEITVVRFAAVSPIHVTWMALRPTMLLMLVALLMGEYVVPPSGELALQYWNEKNEISGTDLENGQWFTDGDDYVYINGFHSESELAGIVIFHFDERSLVSIERADRVVFEESSWSLQKVEQTLFDAQSRAVEVRVLDSSRWDTPLTPEMITLASTTPKKLTVYQLYQYIDQLKRGTTNSIEHQLALWEKVFYPLVTASLVLISISLVFGPLRSSTMESRIFFGILLGIVIKSIQEILTPLSIIYGISPLVAMSSPALVCGGLGLLMLNKTR